MRAHCPHCRSARPSWPQRVDHKLILRSELRGEQCDPFLGERPRFEPKQMDGGLTLRLALDNEQEQSNLVKLFQGEGLYAKLDPKDWPQLCKAPYVTFVIQKEGGSLVAGFSSRLAITLTGVRVVYVDLICAPEGSGMGEKLWLQIKSLAASGPVGGFVLAEIVQSKSGATFWASKLNGSTGTGKGGSHEAQFLFLQLYAATAAKPDMDCQLGGIEVLPQSGSSVDHFGQHLIGIVDAEISSIAWQLAQLPLGAAARAELGSTLERRRAAREKLAGLEDDQYRTGLILDGGGAPCGIAEDADSPLAELAPELNQLAIGSFSGGVSAGDDSSSRSASTSTTIFSCPNGLDAVSAECHAIQKMVGGAARLVPNASVEQAPVALEGASRAHLAGHHDALLYGKRTFAWVKQGRVETVDQDTLVDLLRGLRLVLLNGCKSHELGEKLARAGVAYVVCWSTLSSDVPARLFAGGFWRTIASGGTVRDAFEAGKISVRKATRWNGRWWVPKFELVDPEHPDIPPDADGKTTGRVADGFGGFRSAAGVPVLLKRPAALPGAALPRPPTNLIARPAELDAVRQLLTPSSGGPFVGITSPTFGHVGLPGMPGLGKTVLLADVMNDPWVHGMICPDGAVLIQMNEQREPEPALDELLKALGGAPKSLEKGIAPRVVAIREVLGGRRLLVGLDDVWKHDQAAPFADALSGTSAALLVTSRDGGLLQALLGGASVHRIPLMSDDEGLRLMGSWSNPPCSVEELRGDQGAMSVAVLCGVTLRSHSGALPLALSAVGAMKDESCTWANVKRALTQRAEDVDIAGAQYRPYEKQYRTLFRALGTSVSSLPAELQERYRQLVVFPEDAAFTDDALCSLWQIEKDAVGLTLSKLAKRSLLSRNVARGTSKLHDLQRLLLVRTTEDDVMAGWQGGLVRAAWEQGKLTTYPAWSGYTGYWTADALAYHVSRAPDELMRDMFAGNGGEFLAAAAPLMDARAQASMFKHSDHARLVVETLGKLSAGALATHAGTLVAMLEHSDASVWRAAVETLGKLPAEALVTLAAAMVARAEDSDAGVRRAAVETLGKLPHGTFFGGLDRQLNKLERSAVQEERELARCYAMLAVFPKDASVPLEVVCQLWSPADGPPMTGTAATRIARALQGQSLLRLHQEEERLLVSLLDLHRQYIVHRSRHSLKAWHAGLLHRCGRRKLGCREEGTQDDSYWGTSRNVLHHLTGCGWAPSALGGEVMELKLREVGLGHEGTKGVAAMVAASGSLAELRLSNNEIRDAGAKAIADALAASGSLATLYLNVNKIGDEGAKALADGVAASGSLATLVLEGNEIGDEGAKALAAAVAASGSLATLGISGNKIGDEGAKALAAGVAASGSLTMLRLGGNEIGDEGAKALAAAVAASGSLALKTLVVDERLLKHAELMAACNSKGVQRPLM